MKNKILFLGVLIGITATILIGVACRSNGTNIKREEDNTEISIQPTPKNDFGRIKIRESSGEVLFDGYCTFVIHSTGWNGQPVDIEACVDGYYDGEVESE